MVGDQVWPWGECDAEQLRGGKEHSVIQNALKLKIWFELFGVHVVLFETNTLGVKVPVPRFESEFSALGVDCRLDVGGLESRIANGSRGDSAQHPVNVLRRSSRLVADDVFRVRLETEELSSLSSEFDELQNDVGNIELVSSSSFGEGVLHDPFAQVSVSQRGKQRVPGEVHHRDDPLAFESTRCSCRCRSCNLGLAKSIEFGEIVHDDCQLVYIVVLALVELRLQNRQPLVITLQSFAIGLAQVSARVDKVAVVTVEQPVGFSV